MTIRRPLQGRLLKAWERVVANDYGKQRINSERSLQAAFWAALNSELPARQRMFIEPRFRISSCGTKCVPDIVICGRRTIIAVVELKYKPRGKAMFQKDLRTLDLLSRGRQDLSICNERYAGPDVDSTDYTFSKNTLFVWAGFHLPHPSGSYAMLPSLSSEYPSLNGCFLQMHAETSRSGAPRVFSRSS